MAETSAGPLPEGVPYFVLVGGEHPDLGGALGEWGVEHCSLRHVGQAYACLRRHFARSQVIVVAQLAEALAHLQQSADTGLPAIAPAGSAEPSASQALWRFHLDRTREACAQLMADGGAQYDGPAVNAGTVLGVLRGEDLGGPVVPQSGCRSVHLAVYTHGDTHPTTAEAERTTPCDVCGLPHGEGQFDHEHESQLAQEWYLHMPHPSSRALELQWVATAAARRPEFYLYSTQLRAALLALRAGRPALPVVVLLNACRSGGGLKWFRALQRGGSGGDSRRWPLLLASSCGATQDALVGGLWAAWFAELDRLLSGARDGVGAAATLADLYCLAASRYRRSSWYETLNLVRSSARPRDPETAEAFLQGLREAVCAPQGVDWEALRRLEVAHAPHGPVMCLLCGEFRGARDQEWLCSSCWRQRGQPEAERRPLPALVLADVDLCATVQNALERSAQPQECHGEDSGVMTLALRSIWPRSDAELVVQGA